MKLFVWDNVLKDYSFGIMFAFAEDVDSARALILEDTPYVDREELAREPAVYTVEPTCRVLWGGS